MHIQVKTASAVIKAELTHSSQAESRVQEQLAKVVATTAEAQLELKRRQQTLEGLLEEVRDLARYAASTCNTVAGVSCILKCKYVECTKCA